jgi:hypothetical protein
MSAMAHLEPLYTEGMAAKTQRNGIVVYSLARGR